MQTKRRLGREASGQADVHWRCQSWAPNGGSREQTPGSSGRPSEELPSGPFLCCIFLCSTYNSDLCCGDCCPRFCSSCIPGPRIVPVTLNKHLLAESIILGGRARNTGAPKRAVILGLARRQGRAGRRGRERRVGGEGDVKRQGEMVVCVCDPLVMGDREEFEKVEECDCSTKTARLFCQQHLDPIGDERHVGPARRQLW